MARRSELPDRHWLGTSISGSQDSHRRQAGRDIDPSVLIPGANPCPTLPTMGLAIAVGEVGATLLKRGASSTRSLLLQENDQVENNLRADEQGS
jgi:hypothetical protein